MQTFDTHILKCFTDGLITAETALSYASKKSVIARAWIRSRPPRREDQRYRWPGPGRRICEEDRSTQQDAADRRSAAPLGAFHDRHVSENAART